MRCPFCGTQDTKVINSRLAGEGDKVRRRRECNHCKERFTTYEGAELILPQVVKRDNKREPFVEQKLRLGLANALAKNPNAAEYIEIIIARIIHLLTATSISVLASSSCTPELLFWRSVAIVKPVNIKMLLPASCNCLANCAKGIAWTKGSPPEKLTPSISVFVRILAVNSATVYWFPPTKGQNSGLKHPGQRNGQPCNQSTKRNPGPLTHERGMYAAIFSV